MQVMWANRMLKTKYHYFKPFTRYVITEFERNDLMMKVDSSTNLHFSNFASYERRYGGQDLDGKSVCIYRHNAWGDQLMISSIPKFLKSKYPHATIHMYCYTEVLPLWLGNPYFEGSAIPAPLPFDAMDMYDYHIFYEGMLEGNSERDQGCCYDDSFAFCGFRDVDPKWKVPCIQERPEDYTCVNKLGLNLDKPYAVYHVAPANMNRAYPLAKGRLVCDMLRDELGMNVFVVGVDKEGKYEHLFDEPKERMTEGGPHIINLINRTDHFRSLIPIVRNCNLLVCPDSSVMHLAACFPDVPVVSLWGVFNPNDRIKYYPNNIALNGFDACPHAPCRDHNFFLPEESCKDSENWDGKYCSALNAIKETDILEVAKEKLGK